MIAPLLARRQKAGHPHLHRARDLGNAIQFPICAQQQQAAKSGATAEHRPRLTEHLGDFLGRKDEASG